MILICEEDSIFHLRNIDCNIIQAEIPDPEGLLN